YSRKTLTLVPINRNSSVNKEVRARYGHSLVNINDNQLIFIDETGFNLHSYQRMEYSPVNTKRYINVPNSKGTNISVLCAITQNGILDFQIKIGGFKSSDILNFVETKLPLLTHENRKYVILDNASIHKTANVIESFARRNYILKFLPPYSPQLNPIEEFFSCLKSRENKEEVQAIEIC
ncbi:Transposable element Tc3 transposase, partial [Dictyocoela muelleri]